LEIVASYAKALQAFQDTLERLDLPEAQLAEPGAQEQLGRRAALLATSELTWDNHLGPMFEWSEVAALLGTVGTRQGVHDLARRKRLLALPTKGGKLLYPAFQFSGGHTLSGLHQLLAELDSSGVSPWTQASWFVTPQDELDGQTPAAFLNREAVDERVMGAARRAAARLAA
jgi:hypothetical protein